jgi:hypothetical protein
MIVENHSLLSSKIGNSIAGIKRSLGQLSAYSSRKSTIFIVISIVLISYFAYSNLVLLSSKDSFFLKWQGEIGSGDILATINSSPVPTPTKSILLNLATASTRTVRAGPKINRTRQTRLFCIILATPNSFKSSKAFTILNAWANKCDNYRFVSKIPVSLLSSATANTTNRKNKTVFANGKEVNEPVNLLHPTEMVEDEYYKLTYKMFYTIKDVYLKYSGHYDWFLKADLDTFINVDNLKEFLSDKDPNFPTTFGYDYKVIVERGYHSGGAGYVLSHEAFRRLGEELANNLSFCYYGKYEDVDVHTCLRKLKVYPSKSIDEHGRERFHMISLKSSYLGLFVGGQANYAANPLKKVSLCEEK